MKLLDSYVISRIRSEIETLRRNDRHGSRSAQEEIRRLEMRIKKILNGKGA